MKTTVKTVMCISREAESHSLHRSDVCRRCGGMLVDEHPMGIDSGNTVRKYWAKRCIQCGDVIDAIILRNRYSSRRTFQKIPATRKPRTGVRCSVASQNEWI